HQRCRTKNHDNEGTHDNENDSAHRWRSTSNVRLREVPELPDILLYLHALRPRVIGRQVQRVRLVSPFLRLSVEPPLTAIDGRRVVDLQRLGKRVVFEAEGEL